MTERPPRSNSYQYQLLEISMDFSPGDTNITNSWSADKALHAAQTDEEVLELQQQVIACLWRVVQPHMTQHQSEVLKYLGQGMTQMEIAKEMNCNQSSITKAIHGNTEYYKGVIHYGGIANRIRKVCVASEEFRATTQQLAEVDEGNKIITLIRSWFKSVEEYQEWKVSPMNERGVPLKAVAGMSQVFRRAAYQGLKLETKRRLKERYKLTVVQVEIEYRKWRAQHKHERQLRKAPPPPKLDDSDGLLKEAERLFNTTTMSKLMIARQLGINKDKVYHYLKQYPKRYPVYKTRENMPKVTDGYCRINLLMPEDEVAYLYSIAKHYNIATSRLIRQILTDFIETDATSDHPLTPRD